MCVLNLPFCKVRSLNKEFGGKNFNFFFPVVLFIMEAISIKTHHLFFDACSGKMSLWNAGAL